MPRTAVRKARSSFYEVTPPPCKPYHLVRARSPVALRSVLPTCTTQPSHHALGAQLPDPCRPGTLLGVLALPRCPLKNGCGLSSAGRIVIARFHRTCHERVFFWVCVYLL